MMIYDEVTEMEKSWYELDLFYFCKYDQLIVPNLALLCEKHICNDNLEITVVDAMLNQLGAYNGLSWMRT